jgi:predicted dinucleotide-utilizing enzyme
MSGYAEGRRVARVGILGAGFIGEGLYRHLCSPEAAEKGLAPAFVWARRPEALAAIAPEHRLTALGHPLPGPPDLVVEAAHPDLSRDHGAAILGQCDYMPLSVTALADDALAGRLTQAAERAGTRVVLPKGALVGLQSLLSTRETWEEVTITFRKNPGSIDSGGAAPETRGETVIFDGPVREIARRFPRNVNTMVTCALATVGLDRCRGRLIADPGLDHAVAEVRARGRDGSEVETIKRQPMVGVSGTEMLASTLRSVHLALGRLERLDML